MGSHTAYLQPFSFGDRLPERAVIGGLLANGDTIFVAFHSKVANPQVFFAWLLYARHSSYPWSVRSFKTVSPYFGDY